MLTVSLDDPGGGALAVLCLGAHADDIEIGCGATMLQLARSDRRVTCHWVVLSADATREREARRSAARFLEGCAECDVRVASFRESYFPYGGAAIKDYVQGLAGEISPDIVFTHARGDLHQDHRTVSELTGNAFRDHLVLEYEIPKYDGDLGRPNLYVPVDSETRDRKLELLVSGFPSQATRDWFTRETFESLLRIRGLEARAPSGFAEAFHARKLVLAPT